MQPAGKVLHITSQPTPLADQPRDVAKQLISHLKTDEVLNLSLACKDTFAKYYPFFEKRVGCTPEGLEVIRALMERFQLTPKTTWIQSFASSVKVITASIGSVWSTPQPKVAVEETMLSQPLARSAQANEIRAAFATNWTDAKVGAILRHFFGDAPRMTPPTEGQVDGLRLIASIPNREKDGTPSPNNHLMFLLKSLETLDLGLIKKACRMLPDPSINQFSLYAWHVALSKASWALCAIPPLEAGDNKGKKEEWMAKLNRAQILWKYLAETIRTGRADECVRNERWNTSERCGQLIIAAVEEYSRFLKQLKGAIAQPMAYSEVTQQVQNAPNGLYDCLSEIEEAFISKKRPKLEAAMNTLMNAYLPTYRPAFNCMLARLRAVHGMPGAHGKPWDELDEFMQRIIPTFGAPERNSLSYTLDYFLNEGLNKYVPGEGRPLCEEWEMHANSPLSRAHPLPANLEAAPVANRLCDQSHRA